MHVALAMGKPYTIPNLNFLWPFILKLHYITLQLQFAIASLTTDKVQRCITTHK